MKQINASIITIGDELLIGQTIDTNSAFIGQELNKIGVWVKRRVAVGDVYEDIWDALDEESQHSEIIIITGGLGPTADDITKPLLCDYFGGKLVVNEKVLAHLKHLFEVVFRRTGPMLERNLKQAEVPDNCVVLHNERGSAPGMLFRKAVQASVQEKAPLNPSKQRASPNPSEGGAFDSDSSDKYYNYQTSDEDVYGWLKNFVQEDKSNQTEPESILWERLRGRRLDGHKFRRQHIIDRYIADFVCLSKRLIIEVDGLIHQHPDNKVSDKARTADLNLIGFKVLRFSNEEIINDVNNVLDNILEVLRKIKADELEKTNPPLEGREVRDVVFISLPGVPHEMKGLMTGEVIPFLESSFSLPAIIHRTAFTAGQGESLIAELLKDFEPALPPHIKLAYLPNYGMVKLRLTAQGNNKEELEKEVQPYFEQLQELVKEFLVSNEDEGLEVVIGKILKEKNRTLGTAESCTGGYIAHLVTAVPGSSAYFKGSIVCYANEIKEDLLGVDPETITIFGAVSEKTVKEMASGALKSLKVDYALATSGIMGPQGGSEQKPVGTVWIGVANKDKVETLQLHLRFDRQRNIAMTAGNALNFLRKFILKD
ncbi:MAG TPA: nicotinamide-nucleotide amidohydrolase family protein [Chitinophagaceae bacterium]|nr:nicotinamide-nucleotide amidohydrolase family protein [Chitinophagaceae bacterium]